MSELTTALRDLLQRPGTDFVLEAHNGLSAKIVERAGAPGIWASGLSISAASGLRDCNEMSWSQVMNVVEHISDSVNIPTLVDADSGFGNYNNFRRFSSKLAQRGVAGVCIEDKVFPKINSFVHNDAKQLTEIEEFCGKIKAARDYVNDDNFVIVARVESFIAGTGLDDALARATAYKAAGADAIFIHSKKKDHLQIKSFTDEWNNELPVIIAPTTYITTPHSVFEEMNISLVIWANQIMRSSVKAMAECAQRIVGGSGLTEIDGDLAPLSEVFELTDMTELFNSQKLYLEPDRG